MKGKLIRRYITGKDSDNYRKLMSLFEKSHYEFSHYISEQLWKITYPERHQSEMIIVDYPTNKKPNGIDIDLIQVMERQNRVLDVPRMSPSVDPDFKTLYNNWIELDGYTVGEDTVTFHIEEDLDQDFYIEDLETGMRAILELEFGRENIESILVDYVSTLENPEPNKYIIGVKQKENGFQPIELNPVSNGMRISIQSDSRPKLDS